MSRDSDISSISGNAEPDVKKYVASVIDPNAPHNAGINFGLSVQNRLQLTEVSFNEKADEPQKMEARVVMEIEMEEDMINSVGTLHGGCSAFLVDLCSSVALLAMTRVTQGKPVLAVTSTINLVCHSPAVVGDRLRIINTTMAVGGRAMSARTEIWNVTHHRLVSSGVHVKMQPSPPKAML